MSATNKFLVYNDDAIYGMAADMDDALAQARESTMDSYNKQITEVGGDLPHEDWLTINFRIGVATPALAALVESGVVDRFAQLSDTRIGTHAELDAEQD